MLFEAPPLDGPEERVLEAVQALRAELRYQLTEPRHWTGLLRRVSLARAIRASNSIEGYNVTLDDAVAAVESAPPLETDQQDETWKAVTGYRDALTYCLQLADDPHFTWSADLLRSLHFMMIRHDLEKMPGRWRPGPIYVYDGDRHEQVYEGPPARDVPGLIDELVGSLQAADEAPTIRAAMAHLNLAMIHPFRDGNGRMARAVQTLALAREGGTEPDHVQRGGVPRTQYPRLLRRLGDRRPGLLATGAGRATLDPVHAAGALRTGADDAPTGHGVVPTVRRDRASHRR